MIKKIICLCSSVIFLINAGLSQELPAVHYTTEKEINPLPGPAVTGIYQDRLGYLWLCVYGSGLARYDGHKMEIFNEADSLRSPKTWFAVEDSTGRLWVGTEAGVSVSAKPLGEYAEGRRIEFLSRIGHTQLFKQDLSFGRAMTVAQDGTIYESRDGILFGASRDGKIWQLVEQQDSLAIKIIYHGLQHPVATMYETRDGNLWAATLGSGLVELNSRESHHAAIYGSRNGVLGEVFWEVSEDREGNLWLAQNTGLSKLPLNFRALQFYSAKSYPGQKPNLPASGVMSILRAATPGRETILWAGTENGLAAFNAAGRVELLNTETGLTSNIVFSLAPDKEKRLWIGTRGGLNCLSLQPNLPRFSSWPVQRISLFGANWYLTGDAIDNVNHGRIAELRMHAASTEKVESFWGVSEGRALCFLNGEWLVFRQQAGLPRKSGGVDEHRAGQRRRVSPAQRHAAKFAIHAAAVGDARKTRLARPAHRRHRVRDQEPAEFRE